MTLLFPAPGMRHPVSMATTKHNICIDCTRSCSSEYDTKGWPTPTSLHQLRLITWRYHKCLTSSKWLYVCLPGIRTTAWSFLEDLCIKFHSLRNYKAINGQLHALPDFYLVYKLPETQICLRHVTKRNTPMSLMGSELQTTCKLTEIWGPLLYLTQVQCNSHMTFRFNRILVSVSWRGKHVQNKDRILQYSMTIFWLPFWRIGLNIRNTKN